MDAFDVVVVRDSSFGTLDFFGSYNVAGINATTFPYAIWDTDTVVGPNK